MLLAQYNLSRLVDRIEKAGYVKRQACKDDGRGQVILITASGKTMRRRMWVVYADAIQSALGNRLSRQQLDTLDALLGLFLERSATDTLE